MINFQIIGVIDAGAFGRVERVQAADGEVYARKVFAPSQAISSTADIDKLKARFQREVTVQCELPSTLFVPILHHSLTDDPPWFVMPLCERTLQTEIAQHQKAASVPSEAILDILDSLSHLEQHGTVHRDIKPSNVLLHDGRWKLADLGLVSFPTSNESRLTSTFSAWGTEAYCAPEQRIAFSQCTWRSDQYSFGCILHDIVVSAPRIPYHTHTATGRIGKVIERCTARDPLARFSTVKDLRAAVLAITDGPKEEDIAPAALRIALNLANADRMQGPEFGELRAFLTQGRRIEDSWAVLSAFSDENLTLIATRNRTLFDLMLREYLQWILGEFSSAFIDVQIARLKQFFILGTISQRASIAMTSATFARMKRHKNSLEFVLNMCGQTLEDDVARRMTNEVRIARDLSRKGQYDARTEVATDLRDCATQLGKDIRAYHPILRSLLTEP